MRLHRAQACWEADRLRELFAEAPYAPRLTAEETERHALALAHALNDFARFFKEAERLEAQIARALRKRSGGRINFKALATRRDPPLVEPEEEWTGEEIVERLSALEVEPLSQ